MAKPKNPIPPLPYPLSRATRLTIMITLLSVFFVASTVILFYARGYTFDFTSHKLIHGGALSIETNPPDVTLLINNIKIKNGPPYKISHVLPGNYHIEIQKAGYYPWERDVSIVSNQTNYLHDIDLFKEEKPEKISFEKNIVQTNMDESNHNLILVTQQDATTYELFLFHTKTNTETFLTRIVSEMPPHIRWSEDSSLVEVETVLNNQSNILLFSVDNPSTIQTVFLPEQKNPLLQWESGRLTTSLLYQQKEKILRMNLNETSDAFTLTTSSARWFIDAEKNVWEYNNGILKQNQNGKEIFSTPLTHAITHFIDINSNRIISSDGNNIFVSHLQNNIVVNEDTIPGDSLYYHTQQNYYLAWHQGELYSITPDGTVHLINRFSEDIQDVQAISDAGTLLIVTASKLITFHPRYFFTHDLLTATSVSQVSVDKKMREILFLGTVGEQSGFWRLRY